MRWVRAVDRIVELCRRNLAFRYTFVWRGSINYHLTSLLDTIDALYAKYNTLLHDNGYGLKYDLGCRAAYYITQRRRSRRKSVSSYQIKCLRECASGYGTLFFLCCFSCKMVLQR